LSARVRTPSMNNRAHLVLVLAALAVPVILVPVGCDRASSPSEKQGERNGAGQAVQGEPTAPAPRPAPPPEPAPESTVLTGAPGKVSDEERAARSAADCRLAMHVAEEGMSPREADEFSKLLADMIRTMEDPSWAEGFLRNTALDHLGVARYPECKAGGE
jgi:hypothetical protein